MYLYLDFLFRGDNNELSVCNFSWRRGRHTTCSRLETHHSYHRSKRWQLNEKERNWCLQGITPSTELTKYVQLQNQLTFVISVWYCDRYWTAHTTQFILLLQANLLSCLTINPIFHSINKCHFLDQLLPTNIQQYVFYLPSEGSLIKGLILGSKTRLWIPWPANQLTLFFGVPILFIVVFPWLKCWRDKVTHAV